MKMLSENSEEVYGQSIRDFAHDLIFIDIHITY